MTKKRPTRKGTPQTNKDFTIDCRVNGPCNGQPEINLTGRRAFESSTVRASLCVCVGGESFENAYSRAFTRDSYSFIHPHHHMT